MPDEWFDIVDEADRVIGRECRAEVHRRGLRHRAVHVLVFDAQQRLFLQRRSLRKDTAPGAWDSSAAGHLDCGEDYDACALRELEEELGWRPAQPLRRWLRLGACEDTGQEFVWVYRADWDGRAFVLNRDEIDDGRWFTRFELDAAIAERASAFARSFRRIWREVREASAM